MVDTSASPSKSRIRDRLFSNTFLVAWLRRPVFDIAESVIRLRRLRGMSQAQLAERMGTKQPSIARIEAGLTNLRASSMVELAKALDATIRVELEPVEMLRWDRPRPAWWNRASSQVALEFTDVISRSVRACASGENTLQLYIAAGSSVKTEPAERPGVSYAAAAGPALVGR